MKNFGQAGGYVRATRRKSILELISRQGFLEALSAVLHRLDMISMPCGELEMGKIDASVFIALRSSENAPVTVLISCTEKCFLVKTRLISAGIVVTAIVNDLNTLTARIFLGDVILLESDPDILRIELDATVGSG